MQETLSEAVFLGTRMDTERNIEMIKLNFNRSKQLKYFVFNFHSLVSCNINTVVKILRGRLEELESIPVRAEEGTATYTTTSTVLHRCHPQEPQTLGLFVVHFQETVCKKTSKNKRYSCPGLSLSLSSPDPPVLH